MPADDWFREKCGFTNFRSLGKAAGLDVLVAGCGTGQHSIYFAQLFAGCRVLAVDLSMSSLCYAKEKTRATGIDNIEYAQADILELGGLGRTFDVISSCGTLHHLAEPEVGWRVLLSLLRPDGCMQVGLYSELARRDIVVAQQWLARHGMTPALESLRRGRQELVAAATTDAPLKTALKYPDFYSTSECRDLLLPAREWRYTIPQIKAFLDQNGLEFLGFVIDGEISAQFRETFPGRSIIDLALWHEFETRHPDTFKYMYEFWVQKKKPAF